MVNFWLLFAKSSFEIVTIFGAVYLGVAVGLRHNKPLIKKDWLVILMVLTSVFMKTYVESKISL